MEEQTAIQACLNGGRTQDEHPAVPITPGDLVEEGRKAVAAGASSLHIHPRALDGSETLAPDACAAALRAVRAACPGVPISVTTSLSAEPDPVRRLHLIRYWQELPEMVSVNLHEEGARELCHLLSARGIGIEAGIWTLEAAEIFLQADIAHQCTRVLVEALEADPADALRTAQAISARLAEAGIALPQLHHGEGPATWTVVRAALREGHEIRVGLEDVLAGPNGEMVDGNTDLVRLARELANTG